MNSEWKRVSDGVCGATLYTVEAQERNGKIYTRLVPDDGSFHLLDGAYDTYQEAILTAQDLAEDIIEEIRLKKGR
ncbi:Uncharacterised protein [Bordetella trematum]|nr:Uncharacterised protein [Bordetella trematum]